MDVIGVTIRRQIECDDSLQCLGLHRAAQCRRVCDEAGCKILAHLSKESWALEQGILGT